MIDRDHFIESQLSGLRALGLDEDALKREEALLRSGFLLVQLFERLVDGPR